MDWFYIQNGRKIGPVPVTEFDDLVQSGRIPVETLVWREGLPNWQPLGSIRSQSSDNPSAPARTLPPGSQERPAVRTKCAECGLAFLESEMFPFAGSWICAQCKPIFLQRLREGAPLAAAGALAWRSGDAVVTTHGAVLPARCIKCNRSVTDRPIERTYRWPSNWLVAPFPLFFFVIRQLARVSASICERCRKWRVIMGWLFLAGGIGLLIASVVYDSEWLAILALSACFMGLMLGLSVALLVGVRKADAQHVWLVGVCKEYRDSLPEFPDER